MASMKSACLNVARCALAAWVGAAAMFVVTAVHEVQSRDFTSREKSQLALLRFPTYYQFGFTLVPVAIAAAAIAVGHPAMRKKRSIAFFILIAAAFALMLIDYFRIYGPLQVMLQAEGSGAARPETFVTFHEASKNINMIDISLCFLAVVVLCLPESRPKSSEMKGEREA
jgi:hypothetical protein